MERSVSLHPSSSFPSFTHTFSHSIHPLSQVRDPFFLSSRQQTTIVECIVCMTFMCISLFPFHDLMAASISFFFSHPQPVSTTTTTPSKATAREEKEFNSRRSLSFSCIVPHQVIIFHTSLSLSLSRILLLSPSTLLSSPSPILLSLPFPLNVAVLWWWWCVCASFSPSLSYLRINCTCLTLSLTITQLPLFFFLPRSDSCFCSSHWLMGSKPG